MTERWTARTRRDVRSRMAVLGVKWSGWGVGVPYSIASLSLRERGNGYCLGMPYHTRRIRLKITNIIFLMLVSRQGVCLLPLNLVTQLARPFSAWRLRTVKWIDHGHPRRPHKQDCVV